MTAWQWIQAHQPEIFEVGVVVLLLALFLVGLLLWLGELSQRREDASKVPPLDRAVMDLTDEEAEQRGIK